jgi:drug/metabolite transporter (DMT)-like permease
MDYKFLLIFLTIMLTAVAQVSLKKGAFFTLQQKEFYVFIGLGAILYIGTFFLQVYLLKFFDVSKLTPILTISSMLLIVGLGMWLFGETISLKQGTGIFLGAISIYLILS